MAVHELNLAALMSNLQGDGSGSLDGGRVGEAFAAEVRRVALDCEDRPADGKPRTVTLTMTLTPIIATEPTGGIVELDSVQARFQITSSVPKRRSKQYSFGYRKGGKLVFNDLSDENIHQKTLE